MVRLILSWLLHQANRCDDRREQFYPIKDRILQRYGKEVGYDIQHITGKKCHSCGGKGYHTYYSMYPPYSAYDWKDCWHCTSGWYKLPQWNCLARIRFGRYTFHRPLKREHAVRTPWTENEMGWKVMDRPVIEGYIEHTGSWFSEWALLILFRIYDRKSFAEYWPKLNGVTKRRIKHRLHWRELIILKPRVRILQYWDDEFTEEVELWD
jgi:hypothetical protein